MDVDRGVGSWLTYQRLFAWIFFSFFFLRFEVCGIMLSVEKYILGDNKWLAIFIIHNVLFSISTGRILFRSLFLAVVVIS